MRFCALLLIWGPCSDASPARTVGRLIDQQGSDVAREDYRVSERLALEEIPCRPAIVTLRLGRVAHIDVYVPKRIELLGGTPGHLYQELRNKARALGADAVMSVEERTREDRLSRPGARGPRHSDSPPHEGRFVRRP